MDGLHRYVSYSEKQSDKGARAQSEAALPFTVILGSETTMPLPGHARILGVEQ